MSFGNDLVEVADDADVGELEDRRVRVLVDGDDRPGALHADLVLDGARDAGGDVELRRHGLARLADLGRVRVPAGVDDGARRRDRAAQRLRQLLELREALGPAEPAAAGDDDVRLLDRGAGLLFRVVPGRASPRSRSPRARRRRPRPRLRRSARTGSKLPARKSAMAGSERQPTSTYTLSPSAGRTPTSAPPSSRASTRSQFRPASSRTASAAAMSAASTDWPKNTAS